MFDTAFLDLVLVVVLIGYLVYGVRAGFLVSLGGIIGFLVGGAAAFFAVPLVSQWLSDNSWRAAAVVVTAILLMVAGNAVGTTLGRKVRRNIPWKSFGVVDRVLGGVANVAVAALVMSMLAFTVSSVGVPVLSQQLASSRVITTINGLTPDPVKAEAAQLRAFVLGDTLPRIIEGIGPLRPVPIPQENTDSTALRTASTSIVRITGTAYQCGQNQTGSGFVVAPNRVITNAHVVAGVQEPVVDLQDGSVRTARVVYFDSVHDLAVLAVDNLPLPPLHLTGNSPGGTSAAFGGYPLGGPFQIRPAAIQGTTTVLAPDIYGANAVPKVVYQIAGDVQQGNSGGPLLTLDGAVTGIVFAKSDNTQNVGYAITMTEVRPVADEAPSLSKSVQPGQCTRK
ncbi:MarP family serine protease [Sinomonas humi]|uniref:Colicin V production protein n=1 Tax=Sinomonas humi TaxID=1338436 RepID=A0A0B2ATV5_9MICC|nr:MarP family serine protease [Sinomonas humi]KHL05404.1 colicin V production protein [Sinomonas humi]